MHGHLSAQFQHAKRIELILFIWIQITGGSFILYKLSKIHFGPLSKGMSLAVRKCDFKIFPKRFCPIETKNSTFQSHKNGRLLPRFNRII